MSKSDWLERIRYLLVVLGGAVIAAACGGSVGALVILLDRLLWG